MSSNNFLVLEAHIKELETNLERRDDIYQRKKLSMFIDGWLLEESNILMEMIDENVTVVCSLRRKVKMAIEHLKMSISSVQCGIEVLEQMNQWKLKKKRHNNMFVVEPSLKKQNCRYSYYFQDDISYCKHVNCDINNIIDSGYKYLSCIEKRVRWTTKDKDFLFNGLRECTMMIKWEELEEAIDSKYDANVISSLQKDFDKLRDTEKVRFKTLVSDQIIRDDIIDWTFISDRYLHRRHNAEECERMWKLVIRVLLIVPEYTPEERILLRYLVRQNNFQNWENINAQMPTQRSEFMYFVDFYSKNKTLVKRELISRKNSGMAQRSTIELRSNYANTSWVIGPRPKKGIREQLSKRQKAFMIEYLRKGYSVSAVNRILGTRFSPDWMNKFIIRYNDKLTNRWTSKETSKLMKTVKYIGTGNWSSISKFVGKSARQCRYKYYRLLSQNKVSTKCMDNIKDSRVQMKHITKFLRSSKPQSQVELVSSIQYYFSQCQKNKVHDNVFDKIAATSHVINLFKHLKIDFELSKTQLSTLEKFLENPKNIDDQKIKTIFKKISKSMKSSPQDLKVTHGDGIFTNVVYKAGKVLPPNKCTIYGLYNLIKNQERFAAGNPTNYEHLWNELNEKHKHDKHFIQAKIQWYRILEALFYWPLKLKTIFPENILND